MNFIERRISEYKTAPDVRRVKIGGGDRRRNTSKAVSGIPVRERKKMFEQGETGVSSSSGIAPGGGKRSGKLRKEVSRNSSFRGTKRLKTEDGHSPILGRAKYLAFSNMSLPLWKKLKNFGHFDLQSLTMESLALSPKNTGETEHNVKIATGASAAHSNTEEPMNSDGASNSLVSSCPAFTNEVGGDKDWLSMDDPLLLLKESLSVDKQRRIGTRERMILDGDIPLKSMVQNRGPMNRQVSEVLQRKTGICYPFEFIDYGASYYRNYFLSNEHQNFFGVDENLGPVAISIRREKMPEQLTDYYNTQPIPGQPAPKFFYRIIFRTSELCTLRGTVLEESIPTGAKIGTSKSIPPRDIVEYISQGEIQMSCLKLGKNEKKVVQELVRLDEQELNNKYKVGVIYCTEGQDTEEKMYNNEKGSPAFDEFLELLGQKVRLKGFTKYRAQLDNRTDTTGEYSVYTEYKDAEVMFHVSTLLPHTPSNEQQLLRKRHIGNDIVTIIFQEPGCQQFSPRMIRSHFQHIFIIVRVENPNSRHTRYRVAVSRSTDIPFFGPPIPEGAVFDKNDDFKNFLLAKLINACNASLRNQKFSNMAVRTRRQYLNDLAENGTMGITIDQANTSGRVAGLLRNLGHKKRERTRQDSSLIYTGGALLWHVSIIFRDKRPLPFSEEHDSQIECIMGIGPDMIVFLDFHTKNTLLHIPTSDLSGWIVDKSRMNIFYDDSFCVSLESHDGEDDLKELITRMQAVAPKLSTSHEAILMDFRRASSGFLGFTINEAGVVERVDGLARNSGLQPNSRLLQVEDRLLCCHSHKQITDLLTAREKEVVHAFVVPPPCNARPPMFYPEINWPSIWMSRPNHADLEESVKLQNGVEQSESVENNLNVVELRENRNRNYSNTKRISYMEAMESQHEFDDDEPIYDRLREKNNPGQRSPLQPYSASRRRIKGNVKPARESVLHMADELMERNFTQSLPYDPKPMEHTVSELELTKSLQIANSVQLPDSMPYKASPLAPHHRRTNSKDLKREGEKKATSPLTPHGTVNRIAKRFAFNQSPPSSTGMHRSRIPTPRHGNAPMKAVTSASEMTKSNTVLKSDTVETRVPLNDSQSEIKLRSGGNRRSSRRPASLDASLLMKNEKNIIETSKDDLSLQRDVDIESSSFNRNSQMRTPIRRKSLSRELSPEAVQDDDIKAMESTPSLEPVPRSPTTGALISGDRTEELLSEEIPEHNEMSLMADEKKLSQNTGSQSSQDSLRNLQLTVRERTQRWEARGGGVPSHNIFATLPKSFRHKVPDRRKTSQSLQSSATEQDSSSKHPTRMSAGNRTSSHSGIPIPTSKIPSPRASLSSNQSTMHDVSKSLGREETDQYSNPDDVTKSLTSSGPLSSNESSLERRMGVVSNKKAGESMGDSQSSKSSAAGKSKGKSQLPTSVRIQVSSRRTGQPVTQDGEERVASPTSNSESDSAKPHKSSTSLIPQVGSSSQSSRQSNIPIKLSSKKTSENTLKLDPKAGLSSSAPANNSSTALERRDSNNSLDNNIEELNRNLNELLLQDRGKGKGGRTSKDTHIVEWINQTSKDAVPPDLLDEQREPPQDISSPTFTDNSFTYSQTSEYNQEVVESLKAKVEYMEGLLTKESENNSELRMKLKQTEQKLHEAQNRKPRKGTESVAV